MYTLVVSPEVRKALRKIERSGAASIQKKLEAILEKPTVCGRPLKHELKDYWRARVDPYRIIYEINEEEKQVILLCVDTRDKIYKEFNP